MTNRDRYIPPQRYIRKQDDATAIFPWTAALAARSDMVECDKDGKVDRERLILVADPAPTREEKADRIVYSAIKEFASEGTTFSANEVSKYCLVSLIIDRGLAPGYSCPELLPSIERLLQSGKIGAVAAPHDSAG